jgi:hypothetical protein
MIFGHIDWRGNALELSRHPTQETVYAVNQESSVPYTMVKQHVHCSSSFRVRNTRAFNLHPLG